MGGLAVALTAGLSGGLAMTQTSRLTQILGRRSRWVEARLHVGLALLGGAGAALVATNAAELVGFALLALGCALLVPVDLAAHRLPDRLVGPLYPLLVIPLLAAAGTTGQWSRLGAALLTALGVALVYFALAWVSPANLGLGDVKLSGVLGAFLGWLGWSHTVLGVLAAFALSLGAALVLLAGRAGRDRAYAFGPWMILGAALGAAGGPWLLGP